jgi:hypothetical protein
MAQMTQMNADQKIEFVLICANLRNLRHLRSGFVPVSDEMRERM